MKNKNVRNNNNKENVTRRIAAVSLNFVGICKSSHNFNIPFLKSSLASRKIIIKIFIFNNYFKLQSIASNGFPF
jgi:hypothetical protein